MATQEKFYNDGTEKKLKAIESYLERYLLVFKNQPNMETIYIDAFAGSGSMPVEQTDSRLGIFDDFVGSGATDIEEFVMGSAMRALRLKHKFSKYVFIEQKRAKLNELSQRVNTSEFGHLKIETINGNANEELRKLCPYLAKSNVRAVVFLDPFGNQVGWDLLEALAKTKHVDLWYLFPAMLGVYRQIGNQDAKMTPEQIKSLNHIFGPNNWKDEFIQKQEVTDLFGSAEADKKIANVDDITRYKIKCLKGIFQGGVCDKWLPLGRNGNHWYSLLFAMANPSRPATEIGLSMAKHIMTKG